MLVKVVAKAVGLLVLVSACQPVMFEDEVDRPPPITPDDGVTSSGRPDETTSSGSDSETGAAESDSSEGGSTFVPDNPYPDETWCDPWAKGECPDGEKCMPVALEVGSNSWDSAVCRPLYGDQEEGEPCHALNLIDGQDTCAEGLMCWDPDPDTQVGMCVAMCSGTPDAPQCGEGMVCNVDKNGVINLCMETCTPLEDDCPVGCRCSASLDVRGFWCARQAEEFEKGAPCSWDQQCKGGLACADQDTAACEDLPEGSNHWGCCTEYCDLEAEAPCAGEGEMCAPYYDQTWSSIDPLAIGVGICVTSTLGG
jgi:hypothetical protein